MASLLLTDNRKGKCAMTKMGKKKKKDQPINRKLHAELRMIIIVLQIIVYRINVI